MSGPRWHWRKSIKRVQIGLTVYQHKYGGGFADRWVIQPVFVYDRKDRR